MQAVMVLGWRALSLLLSLSLPVVETICSGPRLPRTPHSWPADVNGNIEKGNWSSSARVLPPVWELSADAHWWERGRLARSMISTSLADAWLPLLGRLRAGHPITVAGYGSSVLSEFSGCYAKTQQFLSEIGVTELTPVFQMLFEMGKGSCYASGYGSLFVAAVNATFPHAEHVYINAGIAATSINTALNHRCLLQQLPTDRPVDVLIFEGAEHGAEPAVIESLFQKIAGSLKQPAPPVLVFIRSMQLISPKRGHITGEEWEVFMNRTCVDALGRRCGTCSAESMKLLETRITTGDSGLEDGDAVLERDGMTHALARRYGWSVLSIREMLAAGLRDNEAARVGWSTCLWINAFMGDGIHPTSRFGARVVADALITLLVDAAHVPCEHGTDDARGPSLPHYKADGVSHVCFVPRTLNVTNASGWNLLETEFVRGVARNKPGWLATAAGAGLVFSVPVMTSSILLRYLTSYEHMGEAEVRCVDGCACQPVVLQAHAAGAGVSMDATAVVDVTHFEVGRVCVLVLTVLETTLSGEHKFKLTGIEV